jgi:ribonuclease E
VPAGVPAPSAGVPATSSLAPATSVEVPAGVPATPGEVPADVAAGAGTPDAAVDEPERPAPVRRRRSRATAPATAPATAETAAGPAGLTAGAAAWTEPVLTDPAAPAGSAGPGSAGPAASGAAGSEGPAGFGAAVGTAGSAGPAVPTEAAEAAAGPAPRRGRRRATAPAASPEVVRPDAEPPATEAAAPPEVARPDAEPPATEAAAPPETAPPARRSRRRAAAPEASTEAEAAVPEAGAPATAAPFTAEPERPTRRRRATAPETTPPAAPAVMFVAPVAVPFEAATPAETEPEAPSRRHRAKAAEEPAEAAEPAAGEQPTTRRRRSRGKAAETAEPAEEIAETPAEPETAAEDAEDTDEAGDRRRRRRGRRGRGRNRANGDAEGTDEDAEEPTDEAEERDDAAESEEDTDRPSSRRRRRRRRRGGSGDTEETQDDDPPDTVVHVRETRRAERDRSGDDEVRGVRGSTRLEAKRQRRREGRDTGRRRPPILTESEFLARREAVDRTMVVRQRGDRTQIAVLEDDILVEHYVTKASSSSYAGNVYLGRVQNVLPSMEAAFVDIGKGRNAVLYAGEVNWDVAGLEGRARSIEHALKSGDNIVVQVTKDPIGHKGARLTSQVSLPGRYLVYVPNGSMTGISRKLPDTERSRLKDILRRIVPEDAGVIIRTAAEGASEEELTRDVERLKAQWEAIQQKAAGTKSAPTLLYAEPDLELRVVRDVFNEDFTKLVVSGDGAWEMISQYVDHVAPDLLPRLDRWTGDGDAFRDLRIDEQLLKGLDRKVWLPSGGSLVIDRTEAMTVIDVNTGKFVGQGGNLEQTVTRNNLEAAEEIVRQLRLRDIGGIIVIDFIDMVLESNRDLVLRRLTECLGRDRTKHQVAEVTSLGLVQMTRKRVGQGLLEAFSEPCPTCGGRGLLVHTEPVDDSRKRDQTPAASGSGRGRRGRRGAVAEAGSPTPALLAGSTPPAAVSPAEAGALTGAGALTEAAALTDAGALTEVGPSADTDTSAGAGPSAEPEAAADSGAEPAVAAVEPEVPAVPAAGPVLTAEPGPVPADDTATPAEIDVASEDHRAGDEVLDTVEAVEPDADVTVAPTAVAGSNGGYAVDPGIDRPAVDPMPDLPVAGSNGVPDGTANGQAAPRRRRRAASRPAGPPQPV